MGDTYRADSTPFGKRFLKVLKSTSTEMFVKPISGRATPLQLPRQAFAKIQEYFLSTYRISAAKPCKIRASLPKSGFLDCCTRPKQGIIIQHAFLLLQAAFVGFFIFEDM